MSDEIQFCDLCSKPFLQVSSYKRHVAYCRRAKDRPKKRQRSCKACSLAKVRCSFQTPCSRCTARNIECVYGSASEPRIVADATPFDFEAFDFASITDPISFETTIAGDMTGFQDLILMDTSNPTHPPPHSVTVREENSPTTWTLSKDYHPMSQVLRGHVMRIGDPLSDMSLDVDQDIGDLRTKWSRCMSTQRSAHAILQSFWSFPKQMLEEDDLPFFIHGKNSMCAEPLLACQRVCQTFVTRTPEILPFIWRCIRAEEEHFLHGDFNRNELLAASQAQVIYIMMMISESGLRRIEWAREMLKISAAVCQRLATQFGELSRQLEHPLPDEAWDTWVFAESLRRKQCIWFVMTLLFNVQNGLSCNDVNALRRLHLPSSKAQWEARSAGVWMQQAHMSSSEGLQTIGDLVDSHRHIEHPFYARSLESWSSKTDQMGTLLNLAVGLL